MGDCREGVPLDPNDYFLDYQDKWINDQSQASLWDKSRRIGATYAESYKACRLRNKIDYARHYYFSSADESSAFEYALYCRMWCEMMEAVVKYTVKELEDEKGYKYNNYITEFPNGSRINCMTSNPRRFRSKGGDICLDEFDWHDNPEEMYDAASPSTTWDYNICILTTRSSEGSPFDNFVNVCKKVSAGLTTFDAENELDWSYHRISIIDAIRQGLAEKIYKLKKVSYSARYKLFKYCRARSRNQDAFGREYLCIPSAEASTLIPYDLYQSCEDANCLKTMGDGDKYLGFDVGREHHRTKIWILEQVGDVLVTRKVETLHKTPYNVQLKVLSDILADRTIRRAAGDATGIGDMLVESLQDKFGERRVEKIKFTANTKDHMASMILGRFEDKRIRVPDNIKIRESFHSIRKTVTTSGNIRYDAATTDEGHADDFWALGTALEAAWQPESVPECILL